MTMPAFLLNKMMRAAAVALPLALAAACAPVDVPNGRTVDIPAVTPPLDRLKALNDGYAPITRVRLGRDVLVPRKTDQDPLPEDIVGPFELRGETLASALQLVTDDYDISLAFESDLAMTRRISVSNLHGNLDKIVRQLCDLADLYCSYRDQVLTVKDTETFVVDLPPLGGGDSSSSSSSTTSSSSSSSTSDSGLEQIASGLAAVLGDSEEDPVIDETTRVLIYNATHRTQKYAERYFQRLRKNTALIIFETHIWEVALDNNNRTGIDWSLLGRRGVFGIDIQAAGGAPAGTAAPISITPTWTGSSGLTPTTVLEFISEQGTVKTVSQPQLTVLSGASATLNVSQTETYVSQVSRQPSQVLGQPDTVTTETEDVESGLDMTVTSAWDQSTIYGTIQIDIRELLQLTPFQPDNVTTIQLPRTTTRGLQTQVRVRPGDAILIGGLVSQRDSYTGSGPGFMRPLIQTARQATTRNTELVFLLRPRVVVFDPGDDEDTPPITNAPGLHSGGADAQDPADGAPAPAPAPLPQGLSPDALAPRGHEPVVMPAGEEEDAVDIPAFRPEEEPAPERMPVLSPPVDSMAPVPLAPSGASGAVPRSWVGEDTGKEEGAP